MIKKRIYLSYPMEFAGNLDAYKQNLNNLAIHLRTKHEVYNPYDVDLMLDSIEFTGNFSIYQTLQKHDCLIVPQLKEKCFSDYMLCINTLREFSCNMIRESDIVIALPTDVVSGGMAGELTLAAYLNKEVWMFGTEEHLGSMSSWVRSCANHIYNQNSIDFIVSKFV